MSFEEETLGFTDQARLELFVWTVYQDLDSVVALREELFGGPVYRDFLNVLQSAWNEVNSLGSNGRSDTPYPSRF